MGGTESTLHDGADFRRGRDRKSTLTRSNSLPAPSRRPREVTSRPKVTSLPRVPPLPLTGSQPYRGSPPAWRRHSLAGINEEEGTDGGGREVGVVRGRRNSIRSEGGFRTEDKPRWILYRKYRNDGRSSHGQLTSGETSSQPGNRYGHGPGAGHRAPNSSHYEQYRPLGDVPRRELPQRLYNSIQPATHSYPLDLHPAPRVSSEPPPLGRGRRDVGRARQTSTSSDPPTSARAASEPGRRHREASSSSESGGRYTRPASTASEPGGRRRPLRISVTYNEIRRERRQGQGPDKLLSEQLLKNAEAVEHVTKTAAEVQGVVSPHDADLVKNHVSVLERKRADLGQTVEHHASTAQQTAAANETLMSSINDFSEWLRELLVQLEHPPAIGVSVAEGEAALQQHYEVPVAGQASYDEVDTGVSNDTEVPEDLVSISHILQLEEACCAVVHDIESHQSELDAMRRQSSSLLRDLSPAEKTALEMTLAGVTSDYSRLAGAADTQRKVLSQQLASREALQRDVQRVRTWLADREDGVRHSAATVRLRSADVEKDIERYKMLLSEVKNYRSNISKLYEQVDDLLDHRSASDSHSLSETLDDISRRYAALVSTLEETLARNQNSLSARKQYESGVLRLDLWRKETEMICSTELQLDSPLEFLDEQHRKQKNLDHESRTFDSTIKDLFKQAESISHELTEADKVTLKDSMNKNRDEFYRVAVLVRKRVKLLSEALASKSRMEGELLAASRWLYNTQDELRRISHTIGHRREDAYIMLDQAKNISEQVEAFEKTLSGLQQTADQAKALDQPTAAEEVARLLTVYTEMRDQVTTLRQKLEAAVALREAYSTSKADMESCLKQGHEQLEAVRVLGVSVPTKLERYKNVEETLSSKGPLLAQIEDKGQQICIEGTPADSRQIREQVTALRVKADNLKQQCDREAAELKQVMTDRLAFASELREQIEQLRQRETDLEARDIFGLSPESVEKELDFYYDERHRVFAQLQAVHEQVQEHRSRYDQLEEAIPLEVQDRMDEFETLRETILEKLKAKGEYLNAVKEERLAYSAAWRVVSDWLTGADSHVQPHYQGIDLTSVEEQLQKHKAVFADQDTIEAKLTQLSQTARSIEPTLDINDKTTMQQSLDNLQQRYADIAKCAQQKEANLLQCAEKWQLYQTTLSQLNMLLKEAEERWETTSECAPRSLPDLHHHVADTQEYSASLDAHLELVEVLNTTSQELDERASSSSQTQIEQSIRNVNERWNILKTKATDKDKALQDTVNTWTSYCQLASQLQNVCETVNKKLGKEDVKTLTMQQLQTKQQDTSTAGEMLETNTNTMTELQKTTQGVLTKLPSCDAKVAIQKELLQLQDKYEQHQWSCKEQQQNLESELVDRERLNNMLREGVAVLSSVPELLTPTELLPLEAATIDQQLTAHDKLRKDINLKIQQVKIVVDSQQEKYAEDGGMPMDLEHSLEELRSLEAQSDQAFKECEEKLRQARSARVQHQAGIETLSSELDKADKALSDSKLTRADNDKIMSGLDALAPTIAALEDSASEIASTVSAEEGQSVQDTIADLRALWVQLSEKADTKAVLLAEISDLRGRFDRDAAVVQAWIKQSEEAVKQELVWTNLHTVQTQLAEYRSLMAKSIPVQGRLEEMGELADRLASREGSEDALEDVTSLSTVHTTTYNEVMQRLNTLEEASVLYLTYSSEVEIVARWMQQTRQAFKVAQRAPTITEQLSLQDALVKDIEHHEGRVKSILAQHDKLQEIAEQLAPTHGGKELAAEISDLKEATLQRREQLAKAVDEEKKHDEQIQELSTIMSSTRATLEAAPAVAGTVEELHQQIQEHNALTEQLESAKILIDELTEENRILREQMQSMNQIGEKLPEEQVLPDDADLSSNDAGEINGASVGKSEGAEIAKLTSENVESVESQDRSINELAKTENAQAVISGVEKADTIYSVPGEVTESKEYQLNNPVSQQSEVLQTCSDEGPSQEELTIGQKVETSSVMTESSQIQAVTSDDTVSYYTENSTEDKVTQRADTFETIPTERHVEQQLEGGATSYMAEEGHHPADDAVYQVAEIQHEPLGDSETSNVDVVERPLNEAMIQQTGVLGNLTETTEMDHELHPVLHQSTLSDDSEASPDAQLTETVQDLTNVDGSQQVKLLRMQTTSEVIGGLIFVDDQEISDTEEQQSNTQQMEAVKQVAYIMSDDGTSKHTEVLPESDAAYHLSEEAVLEASQVDIADRPLNEAQLQQIDATGNLSETTEMEQGMQQELSAHQSMLPDESVSSQVDIADRPLTEVVLQPTDAVMEATEMDQELHQELIPHKSSELNETVLQKEVVLHHLPDDSESHQISLTEGLPKEVASQSTEIIHELPTETDTQHLQDGSPGSVTSEEVGYLQNVSSHEASEQTEIEQSLSDEGVLQVTDSSKPIESPTSHQTEDLQVLPTEKLAKQIETEEALVNDPSIQEVEESQSLPNDASLHQVDVLQNVGIETLSKEEEMAQTLDDAADLEHTVKIEYLQVQDDRASQQAEVVQQTLPIVDETSLETEMVEDIPEEASSQQQILGDNATLGEAVLQSQPDQRANILTEVEPEGATTSQPGGEDGILHIATSSGSELLESQPQHTTSQQEVLPEVETTKQIGGEDAILHIATLSESDVLESLPESLTSQEGLIQTLADTVVSEHADDDVILQQPGETDDDDTSPNANEDVTTVAAQIVKVVIEGALDQIKSTQNLSDEVPQETEVMQSDSVNDTEFELAGEMEEPLNETAIRQTDVIQSLPEESTSLQTEMVEGLQIEGASQTEDLSNKSATTDTHVVQSEGDETHYTRTETVHNLSVCEPSQQPDSLPSLTVEPDSLQTEGTQNLLREQTLETDTVQKPSNETHLEQMEETQPVKTDKSSQQLEELQSLPVGMNSQEIESLEEMSQQQELGDIAAPTQIDELQDSTSNTTSLHGDRHGSQETTLEDDAVSQQPETHLNDDTSQQAVVDQDLTVKAAQIVKVVLEGALDQMNTKQGLPADVSQGTEDLQNVSGIVTDSETHLSEEPTSEQGEIVKFPDDDSTSHQTDTQHGAVQEQELQKKDIATDQTVTEETQQGDVEPSQPSEEAGVLPVEVDGQPDAQLTDNVQDVANDDGSQQVKLVRVQTSSEIVGGLIFVDDQELSDTEEQQSNTEQKEAIKDQTVTEETQQDDVDTQHGAMQEQELQQTDIATDQTVTEETQQDDAEPSQPSEEAGVLPVEVNGQPDAQLTDNVQDLTNDDGSQHVKLVRVQTSSEIVGGLIFVDDQELSDTEEQQSNTEQTEAIKEVVYIMSDDGTSKNTEVLQSHADEQMSSESNAVHHLSEEAVLEGHLDDSVGPLHESHSQQMGTAQSVQDDQEGPSEVVKIQPVEMHSELSEMTDTTSDQVERLGGSDELASYTTDIGHDLANDVVSHQTDMVEGQSNILPGTHAEGLQDLPNDAVSEQSDIVIEQSKEIPDPHTDMLAGSRTDETSGETELVHGESDVLALQQNDVVPDHTVVEGTQQDDVEPSRPSGGLSDAQLEEKEKDSANEEGSQQVKLVHVQTTSELVGGLTYVSGQEQSGTLTEMPTTLQDRANYPVSEQSDIVHGQLNELLGPQTDTLAGSQTDATSEETEPVHDESDVLALQQNDIPDQAITEGTQENDMEPQLSDTQHGAEDTASQLDQGAQDLQQKDIVTDQTVTEETQQIDVEPSQPTGEAGVLPVEADGQPDAQLTDSVHDLANEGSQQVKLVRLQTSSETVGGLRYVSDQELMQGSSEQTDFGYVQEDEIAMQQGRTMAEHEDAPFQQIGVLHDQQQLPTSEQAEMVQGSSNDSTSEYTDTGFAQQDELAVQQAEMMQQSGKDEPIQQEGVLHDQNVLPASETAELIQGSSEQTDFGYAKQDELAMQQEGEMADHDSDVPFQQVGILHDQKELPTSRQAEMIQGSPQEASSEYTDSEYAQEDELTLQQRDTRQDQDKDTPLQQEGLPASEQVTSMDGLQNDEQSDELPSNQTELVHAAGRDASLVPTDMVLDNYDELPLQREGVLEVLDEAGSHHRDLMISQVNRELAPQQEEPEQGLADNVISQETDNLQRQPDDTSTQQMEMPRDLADDASSPETLAVDGQPNQPGSHHVGHEAESLQTEPLQSQPDEVASQPANMVKDLVHKEAPQQGEHQEDTRNEANMQEMLGSQTDKELVLQKAEVQSLAEDGATEQVETMHSQPEEGRLESDAIGSGQKEMLEGSVSETNGDIETLSETTGNGILHNTQEGVDTSNDLATQYLSADTGYLDETTSKQTASILVQSNDSYSEEVAYASEQLLGAEKEIVLGSVTHTTDIVEDSDSAVPIVTEGTAELEIQHPSVNGGDKDSPGPGPITVVDKTVETQFADHTLLNQVETSQNGDVVYEIEQTKDVKVNTDRDELESVQDNIAGPSESEDPPSTVISEGDSSQDLDESSSTLEHTLTESTFSESTADADMTAHSLESGALADEDDDEVLELTAGSDGNTWRNGSLSPRTISIASPGSSDQSLCSEFVAIPYLQEVLNRSRHSGTDHSMSLPLSMSRSSTPSVTEINMSWANLQDQLAQRSEELTSALGSQEKFQQSVQNIARHVNDVLTRLDDLQTVTSLEDATNKMKELQTLRIEVETVYEDVAGIKKQGQAISAKAGPEGCAPMNLTLQMLDDQLRHLEDKLTDSENRLQDQYEEQEHKTRELLAYETAVADIEKWVSVARECIVREHYIGQDPEALQQQLLKAQQVQEQLPARLQQLSDLAVTADHLAELGPPDTAAALQQQVAGLRANAEKFGLQLAQTTEQLKDDVKVAERKKQELVEYKTSVVNIQRWIEDIQLNGSADETDRMHGDSQNMGDGPIRPQRQSALGSAAPGSAVPSSPEEREDSMSRSLADLQDLWRGVQEAEAAGDEQLARQRREQFYRRYQEAARVMASWLDDVELALFSTGFDRGTEQQLKENEMMQEELASLGQYITVMKDISKQIAGSQDSRDSSLCDTIRNLSDRVEALEAESEQRQRELQSSAGSMHEFEEELRLAQTPFTDIQQRLSILLQSTAPLEAQLADMESLEEKLIEYDEQFGRLSQRSEGMLDTERTLPPMELTLLQSRWAELREQVAERKHEILAGMEMQSQYEKLLNEYAEFIETAERKLDEEERLQAVNLPNMKQQLEAHKEFFGGLETHRVLLDGMAEKVDASTWQHLESRHASLTTQTQATEHRAALHRQRLEQTLRQWEDFDRHFDSARDCLHRLEQQRPVKVEKEQDIEKLRRRIWDYNSIQGVLGEEKPSMFQCVEKGKQLLQKITCPALQSDITDFSDQLLRINNDTSSELKRLETVVDQWEIYERESTDLEEWLVAAKEQLGRISTTDDLDLQNISAIRTKMDSFLDFRKEIESKQAQKTKVSVLGQQLQRLRPSDTQLREGLERLETDWLRLMCDLPNNEEALHAAQMELLPSRQALGELNLWMDSVESSIHDDHHDYCSLLDVQMALQKYRGLKVDLSNKQLTVDFVNQMSMQSTEGLADTEFDEKLGRVNARYQLLSSDLAEQLRTLELLQVRWEEYDQVVNRMRNWFSDQEAKVTKLQHVGHDVSVRRSVAELKTIHEDLTKKEAEIDAAKVLGTGLVGAEGETPGGTDALSAHMEDINSSWARLDHEVYQLLNTLEDALQQWDAYNGGLQEVNGVLMEAESVLVHYNTASGDLSTFSEQLAKLRAMQSKVDTVKGDLDQLQYCGGELSKVCEEAVGQSVLQNIHGVEQRWEDVRNRLDDRIAEFEDTLDQWENYDETCRNTKSWLKQHEKSVAGVLQEDDGGICTPQHVSAAKALCEELDAYQPQLMSLGRLSNQLGPRMDSTALIHLRATETSLNQQHGSLLSTLSRHVDSVQKVLKKYTRFREILEALQRFLTVVEATLAEEDPVASADEETIRLRIKALQELLGEVGEKQSSLDELNHIGYRLPLNKEDTAAVREVNTRWQGALGDASQRYRQLQANLLLRQDFHEKCLQWGHFLARVEKALAEEIAGNYKALVDQQRAFEMFETEMHSRQQVLHAIIKEGEQMVTDGDVEEKAEFQQKLAGLQDQWHGVLVRARERKGLIDSGISQWHTYRNQLDRMNTKIDEMEDIICNLDFPQAPVQKIKLLLESIKHLYGHLKQFNVTACLYTLAQLSLNANFEMHQRDMASSEPIYQKLTALSEQLQATSEPGVSSSLRRDLTAIQDRWVEMARKLEDRRADLERLMGNWSSTEAGIDDIVTWLREIRLSLAHELPDNYDQLEHELRQCKEFQAAFVTHVEKRDALAAHEESLAVVISPEDLAVLQQRLRLLSKQWEEIRQQVATRQHRLTERLAEWTRFGEQYTEMLGWVTAMESKVNGGQEFHMEDMLTKLQKDYKTEMANKTDERNKLVNHGRRLMAGSSEVRANDIDYKIRRLLDKWQRLEDQMATRHKKLQETLQAVQQLESNMSGLRRWLAYIEHELGSPVIFHHPDMPEIQTKLHHHQDLQKDVEKHSAGVASVLNLCEVLLHDHDACPSDVECGAIEQAMCSLDKRWKNICSLVSERRQKIEETWELWQHFHDDHLRMDEWLRYMEVHTRSPCCNEPTFDTARTELKKFETFQQEFQANISQLEALNRQYRRLAREGRTDTAGTLKRQAETINKRWDQLQSTVSSITRRLKHTINVKDDFEATRQALIMWLNNLNLQISKATVPPNTTEEAHRKASSVSVELDHNQQRVEYLEKAGLYLMQKCEPADAVLIERDLGAFRTKHQDVRTNLDLLLQRLNAEDDDEEISDEDLLQPQSLVKEFSSATYVVRYKPKKDSPTKKTKSSKLGLDMYEIEPVYGAASNGLSSPEGDVTPPSEQDSEPEEEQTREQLTASTSTLNSQGTSPVSPWEAVLQALVHKSTAKRLEVEGYLRDLDRALSTAENQLDTIEKDLKRDSPLSHSGKSSPSKHTARLEPIQNSMDMIHRLEKTIRDELGLLNLGTGGERRIRAAVKRWNALNSQAQEKAYKSDQKRHHWLQFSADLRNLTEWVQRGKASMPPPGASAPNDLRELEAAIRKHKDFNIQLENKKPIVISINILSKSYLSPESPNAEELKDKLTKLNRGFDELCTWSGEWQSILQKALVESTDFTRTVQQLQTWMKDVDGKMKDMLPISLGAEKEVLLNKYGKLKVLHKELEYNSARVSTLHDIACHLPASQRTAGLEAAIKQLATLRDRMNAAHKTVASHKARIETALNIKTSPTHSFRSESGAGPEDRGVGARGSTPRLRTKPSLFTKQPQLAAASDQPAVEFYQEMDNSAGYELGARRQFVSRVLRTAVPLQMMLLLLLGVACLVPMSEEDFSCVLANNFKRSLDPMLHYTDGPPPF